MAYNTKEIVKDRDGNPISQYYNPAADKYEPVEGVGGGNAVVIYNADGTENNSLSLIPILDKLSELTGTAIDEETRKDNELQRIALYEQISQMLADGDLKGDKGDTGLGLQFDWDGTKLGVRVEGQTQYVYVQLKGEKGDKGDTGEIENLTKGHIEDALGFTPENEDNKGVANGYASLDNTGNVPENQLGNISIPDMEAENISYDNTESGLEAEDVQGAIDEVVDDLDSHLAETMTEIANVKTGFGAKGDGITDDTSAIQNALDYVESRGGGIVYIPPGTYILEGALHIGNNVRLIGSGKSTVLDATEELTEGSYTIHNKGRGGCETYDGASCFSIENLSLISSTRKRQGLYFDNAVDFQVRNIWGLGKCLDHYIDVNNSKNGLFENIYLTFDPQGTAPFQIDSREGQNNGITVKNLFVNNPNPIYDTSALSGEYAAIHFHRTGAKNINISNVFSQGMNVFVYKDSGMKLENVSITNVKIVNCVHPLNFTSSGDNRQKNILFRDWIIESDQVNRGFGRIFDTDNLTIENISINVNGSESEPSIDLVRCDKVGIGGIEFTGEYKGITVGRPLSFIGNEESSFVITKAITGEWLPDLRGSITAGTVTYSRQQGWYTIIGNIIYLNARLTMESIVGGEGNAYVFNLPVEILDDHRPAGSIGIGGRYKGSLSDLVVTGASLSSGDILRFNPAFTEDYVQIQDLDDSFLTFSISYMF